MKADEDEEIYRNENEQLRLLHLERQKRLKKETNQSQEIIDQEVMRKKINVNLQENIEQSQKCAKNTKIWLNSVIYDKREPSQKINMMTIPSFFQDIPTAFTIHPFSKNIVAILISNYGFQMEVFDPIVKLGVPFFVVNRMEDLPEGKVERNFNGFKNMYVISPPKQGKGYGVFHIKLWLIKFKDFLRVVVGTGNNHVNDWMIWQNAYWYQDFPSGTSLSTQKNKDSSQGFNFNKDFVETLKLVIHKMQPKEFDILKVMGINLDNYHFKDINVILIPSFSGRFKNQEMNKIGLQKVKTIMKKYGKKRQKPTLTYNTSSLGMISEMHVRQIYFSFCPYIQNFSVENYKLVYPTDKYAKETCGQIQVLFLMESNYQKSDSIKTKIMYKYQPSKYNGVVGGIPHLKTIVIESSNAEDDSCVLYVGSHNMTKAAWGTYEKNDSQLWCMNEELGLLFLDYKKEQLMKWLPYQYPPTKYGQNDKPFFRQE